MRRRSTEPVPQLPRLLVLLALAGSATAHASSGRQRDVTAGDLAAVKYTVPANVAVTIETADLAPAAADTVLTVVRDPTGEFVAGNDDAGGSPRSIVRVGPNPATLDVLVLVRAARAGGEGSATLRITPDGVAAQDQPITFGSPTFVIPGVAGGGWIDLVGQPAGADDSVLMVLDPTDPARTLAVDDDGGVGTMSRVHLTDACADPCTIAVGARRPGPLTVVWDEDRDQHDADGDGLGDALEQAIGTDPNRADTDRDGLSDGDEVLGVEPAAPAAPIELPRYGADPSKQDIFVQADWEACDPIVSWCGPNNTMDQHQMAPAAAARLAAYFAPDFALHVDDGVAAGDDPVEAAIHGAWGGATRQPPGNHPCSPDSLGARFGMFHRGVVSALGGGGGGDLYGFCFGGDSVRMGVDAQELGHNFGMDHGGDQPSGPANCKPHYRSPMNYAYTYEPTVTTFSRDEFAGVDLDPFAMDEIAGLGTTDPVVLDSLRGGAFAFAVRDDGAIDWNRDGVFETTPVRAAPTWAYSGCDQSKHHFEVLDTSGDPTLVWLTPKSSPARFYAITRRPDGTVETRFTTRFDACDPAQEAASCTNWSPAAGSPGDPLEGAPSGQGAASADNWTDASGEGHLAIVAADAQGILHALDLSVGAGGGATVGPPVTVDAQTAVTGDPAVTRIGARVIAFAPVAGALRSWDLDTASGAWSTASTEMWTDGTPIAPCFGIAVARGHLADAPASERLVAAIPVEPYCQLAIGVYDEGSAAWQRLDDAVAWSGEAPMTGARPGLAYVPFDPTTPNDGRFYLGWKPYPDGVALITMTEGADPTPGATARRLKFLFANYFVNSWSLEAGGMALACDPAHDANLRAAWVYAPTGGVSFFPFADGITDVHMFDQDDYVDIRGRMACSLTASCQP